MIANAIPFVENSFGRNDFFIIAAVVVFYGVILILPKLFSNRFVSFLLIFIGILFASLFDSTIGAAPFDFYDIMDGPKYTVMDLFAYLVYGPFGYLFIYYYVKWDINGIKTIFYIALWTLAGILFEWINVKFDVFTYKSGYQLTYSIPIYLLVQTVLVYFYEYIRE
ncbi:hypothetical protein IMZ08_02715 [Bacillus luteolus]|uniref:Rod shape-determining protein MreD n=1 Tax=Litchfieldia luteola TaxID=682179 RepID=A0ABR9QEP9_9BACI|nr:hypothetical protein [Cytobacillus luteolus]MBE4906968.1 hypothetical protein [Cytobacillus luteolus]MBP1943566.1 hypothetical protein [Cytobacillus luteolus]